METLITATTEAKESNSITLSNNSSLPPGFPITVYITGTPLGIGEYVRFQYYDGSAWRFFLDKDGNYIGLSTSGPTHRTIHGPIEFRAVKSVTAAPIGVKYSAVKNLRVVAV